MPQRRYLTFKTIKSGNDSGKGPVPESFCFLKEIAAHAKPDLVAGRVIAVVLTEIVEVFPEDGKAHYGRYWQNRQSHAAAHGIGLKIIG
jgi:hypothetical protein